MALIKKGSFIEKEKKTLSFENVSLENSHRFDSTDEEKLSINQSFVNNSSNGSGASLPDSTKISTVTDNKDNSQIDLLKKEKQLIEQEIINLKLRADEEISILRKNAISEAEIIKNDAREEGYNTGKIEAEQQYTQKIAEIGQAVNSIMDHKKSIIKETEGELLKLSIKIAEQIIRSEISLNQGVALNIVSEAITKITDRDRVMVKVSKSDFDFVQKNKDRIMTIMDDIRNLTIQEDGSIEPGGCIIETDLGYVDSRVSIKLEAIKAALLKLYNNNNPMANNNMINKPQLSPITQPKVQFSQSLPIAQLTEEKVLNEDIYNQAETIDDYKKYDLFDFDDGDDLFK